LLTFTTFLAYLSEAKSTKPIKEITSEIAAIMRQITASITFLPLLQEPCCFDLLVYADKEATVPLLWEDSDPCLISNAEQVMLRSFNTKVRKQQEPFISCFLL
jgi:mitotic spindle assembly checkpoint protein MAD2